MPYMYVHELFKAINILTPMPPATTQKQSRYSWLSEELSWSNLSLQYRGRINHLHSVKVYKFDYFSKSRWGAKCLSRRFMDRGSPNVRKGMTWSRPSRTAELDWTNGLSMCFRNTWSWSVLSLCSRVFYNNIEKDHNLFMYSRLSACQKDSCSWYVT